MKKWKTFILAVVLLLSMAVSVHADSCCYLYDVGVTETDEGLVVTFSLDMWGAEDYRNIVVSFDNRYSKELEGAENGEHSVTFLKSELPELIKGETYSVIIKFSDNCPYGNDWMEDSVWYQFTCQNGTPTLNFADIPDGKLQLVGGASAIVKAKAPADGLYEITATRDDGEAYGFTLTPADRDWGSVDKYNFFDQDEEYLFRITNKRDEALDFTVTFKEAEVPVTESLINDPKDGDVCFKVDCEPGMMYKFTIEKAGVYLFAAVEEPAQFDEYEGQDGIYINCQTEGNDFSSGGRSEIYELMKAGEYYVDTQKDDGNKSVTITYVEPGSFEFDKAYTLENSEKQYYMLTVDRPMTVKETGKDMYTQFINVNREHSNSIEGILMAGKYYVEIAAYSGAGQVSYAPEYLESVALDTPIGGRKIGSNHYIVFQAPADGVYEFDFTEVSIRSGHTYYSGDTDSSWKELDQREMKQDEWVLVRVYKEDDENIYIRKYKEPQPVELTLGVAAEFTYISGKTYLYKFTPAETGEYKFRGEKDFFSSVKVYTDEETLTERDSLDFVLDLEQDIPVYIELFGENETWGNDRTDSITVMGAVTELVLEYNRLTVSKEFEEKAHYTGEGSGYCRLYMSTYSSSGQVYYILNDNGQKKPLSAGYYLATVPFDITFIYENTDSYGSSETNVNIKIQTIETEENPIVEGQPFNHSSDKYYVFAPQQSGLYAATAKFEVLSLDQYGAQFNTGANGCIFFAEAGETYLLKSSGGFDDTVSLLDTASVELGNKYVADGDINVYELKVEEAGYYRVDIDSCNASLHLYDGEWKQLKKDGNAVVYLDAGMYYLAVKNNEVSGMQILYGHYEPRLEFSVEKDNAESAWSITVEDCYYSKKRNRYILALSGTVPYGVEEAMIACNYNSDWGGQDRRNETIAVGNADRFYAEFNISSVTKGKQYTFTPEYRNEDGEWISGEPVTLTVRDHAVTRRLESNHVQTEVRLKDGIESQNQYFVYEFTQPEDWEGTTEIEMRFFTSNFGVYGKPYIYTSGGDSVSYQSVSDKKYTYDLTPGETYYIYNNTANEGLADIYVSSLPAPVQEPGTEDYEIQNVRKSHDGLRFDLIDRSGDLTGKTVWVSANNDENRMLDAAVWQNGVAKLDKMDEAAWCKLIILDENLIPCGLGETFKF